MLDANAEFVVRLGIEVLPDDKRDLDSIAKEIEEATGEITRVNDPAIRLIVVGVAESRVARVRQEIANLGFMTGVRSSRRR